jgi:hypothetical protein
MDASDPHCAEQRPTKQRATPGASRTVLDLLDADGAQAGMEDMQPHHQSMAKQKILRARALRERS